MANERIENEGGRPPASAKLFAGILHSTDLIVALIIFAASAVLYYFTTTFEEVAEMFAQDVPPEFFPQLVLLLIALLAIALPFEHLAHTRRGESIDSERKARIRPMPYVTAALLILVVLGIPYLGSILAMVAVCVALPLLWGERRLHLILPFAIVFPLAVTFVFNGILQVYFEPGLFGLLF